MTFTELPAEPQPRCRTCRHWNPRDDHGGRLYRTTKRRCRRFTDFFTLPEFYCRSYEDKEAKKP